MDVDDDLLLSLAVEACDEESPEEAAHLQEADLFSGLASASGGASDGKPAGSGGPRLSWAAKAAAAGSAGTVPLGHQPRRAVMLPPGAIPRSAALPQTMLLPGQLTAAAAAGGSRGVAIFGASQPAAAAGQRGSAAAATYADSGQGSLVERNAGLKIKNPRVSHTQLLGRLADTSVLRLSQVRQRHRTAGLEGSWATMCVIGEKSKPRETANGRSYSVWKVTDLDQTCLSLFLFSGAHDDMWREGEGTIIALFTPKVRAEGDFSLSVDSSDQIWVLGQSPEFGYCKAKKKNGEACRMPVNVSRCPFCPFHVQTEYNRIKPTGRTEFQTTNIKTAFRPGMQRGLQWAPGEFESQTAKQLRIKQMGAAQLEGFAATARERGSAVGARYLTTVANPAAAAAAETAAQRRLTPAAAIAAAAQLGPVGAALAAAPIPAARTGGQLVLQLRGGQQHKRKAAATLAEQAGGKRQGSAGGSAGGGGGNDQNAGGMIDLEDDEDELVPAGTAGAAGWDPTADARQRALALLRAAGGTPAGPSGGGSQVPAALQADVERMRQRTEEAAAATAQGQQQQQQQQAPAPAAGTASDRAALAQVEANRQPPPLPSVVSGRPSAARLPPTGKRPVAAGAGGSKRPAVQRKPAASAAAAAAAAGPQSAMEAAFGGVLQDVAATGAAGRGTRYKDLVDDEEHEKLDKVMTVLEHKDEVASKMDSISRLVVQAFRCKVCNYTAERRRPECAGHPYAVERVESTKRWWQCDGCKFRFTTVGQKYPAKRCTKCNQPGTGFTAVSMLRPQKEHEIVKQQSSQAGRDKMMSRGAEQKWCNSW